MPSHRPGNRRSANGPLADWRSLARSTARCAIRRVASSAQSNPTSSHSAWANAAIWRACFATAAERTVAMSRPSFASLEAEVGGAIPLGAFQRHQGSALLVAVAASMGKVCLGSQSCADTASGRDCRSVGRSWESGQRLQFGAPRPPPGVGHQTDHRSRARSWPSRGRVPLIPARAAGLGPPGPGPGCALAPLAAGGAGYASAASHPQAPPTRSSAPPESPRRCAGQRPGELVACLVAGPLPPGSWWVVGHGVILRRAPGAARAARRAPGCPR